jgi:hypothetical protein
MSVIGSFNGASIIALPSSPAPRQLELVMNDTVAVDRSPFTGSTQVQAWPGADWWEATFSLPQLTRPQAAVWAAFLGELRGMQNVFYLGDPLHPRPCGTPRGEPVVNGVNAAMSATLNTRGWTADAMRLLLPGDYLQLGTYLHRVLDVVNADGSGNASISLWPSIRVATTDGQAVTFNKPQGLFRLAENRRSYLGAETRLTGISFKCIEAR